MAAIALTAAQISTPYPNKTEIYSLTAAVAITAGQAVYTNSNGLAALADASAASTLVDVGIALEAAGVGQAVSVLYDGFCAGFTVSSLAVGALAYVSDDAGALADAAGTVNKVIGRVRVINQSGSVTKCLYVEPSDAADFEARIAALENA